MGASNKNALPKMISTDCGSVQSLAQQFAAVRKLGFSRVISQQRVRGNWANFFKAEIWFFALLYFNKWSTILCVPGKQRTNERFSSIPNIDWAIQNICCVYKLYKLTNPTQKNSTYFCKFENKICIVNKIFFNQNVDRAFRIFVVFPNCTRKQTQPKKQYILLQIQE